VRTMMGPSHGCPAGLDVLGLEHNSLTKGISICGGLGRNKSLVMLGRAEQRCLECLVGRG
jgi:hypothetical protein